MINRGSEWRRWNLHMHSEYSREARTKMKITEIFDCAVKNNISMISVTDHSNFDALDEIWDIYQNVTCEQGNYSDLVDFLPGIELKTDKGKKGVHIISVFPKEIVVNRQNKQLRVFYMIIFAQNWDCLIVKLSPMGMEIMQKGYYAQS